MQSSSSADIPSKISRLIKLFTIKDGISQSLLAQITQIGSPHYEWTDSAEKADYLVFPTNYEVGHELTTQYIDYFNGKPDDIRWLYCMKPNWLHYQKNSIKK